MDEDENAVAVDGVGSLAALRTLASESETIGADPIAAFLRRQPELQGHDVRVSLASMSVAAGASGGTIGFTLDVPHELAVYRGDYILRFDIGDAGIFSQTSLKDQFGIMRALHRMGLPVPDAVWFDATGEIAPGARAIIMRRVIARSPNIQYLQAGAYAEADATLRRCMVENLIGLAARLHAVPVEKLDIPALDRRGGEGLHFIDREIIWAQAELHARFPEQEEGERAALHTIMRKTLDQAAIWLRARAPRDRKPVLAHGDLTLANSMYNPDGSIAALLDWELCHHGLPAEDIAYFIYAASAIASLGSVVADVPSKDEIIAMYRDAGGNVQDWDYAAALSAFRLATWGAIGMRRMPREFWSAQKLMWELQSGLLQGAMESFGG